MYIIEDYSIVKTEIMKSSDKSSEKITKIILSELSPTQKDKHLMYSNTNLQIYVYNLE